MIGAARMFARRMFAPRYWPKVGAAAIANQRGTVTGYTVLRDSVTPATAGVGGVSGDTD